jgi:hypothetical protein
MAAIQPFEKQYWSSSDRFSREPVPLRRIYLIEDGDTNEIQLLPPQEALIELVRHSYVIFLVGPTGTSASHFAQCTALAREVPVCRLIRRRSLGELPEVARQLEQDMARAAKQDPIVAP